MEGRGCQTLPHTPGPLSTSGRPLLEAFQFEIRVQSFSRGGEPEGGAALSLNKWCDCKWVVGSFAFAGMNGAHRCGKEPLLLEAG